MLGLHMMHGETLLELLRRVEAGEKADDVYLEMFANADHVSVELGEEDDG